MNKKVCDFMIVRCIDAASTFTHEYPRFLKEIPYKGFSRDSFDILCTKYHEKSLPDNFLKYYSEVRRNCANNIGEYAEDEASVLSLLEYSNQLEGKVNELIAFNMSNLKNHDTYLNLEFLGVDIGFYAGSLIYEDIFSKREVFKKYHSYINENGLFLNNEIARQYIGDYCAISMDSSHKLEPLSKNEDTETICLFRYIHME